MKYSRILLALLVLVVIVTACAPAPTATPVPPTAAPKPTEAPKPAATAVPPTAAPKAAEPTKAPAATAAPTKAAEPTKAATADGGTLIGAFDVGPGGGPQQRPFDNSAGNTWLMKIFTPLVSLNKDSTGLEAQLATKWTANATATVWTFNLRPNVKWHDGSAFTANDVKFTFELACNPSFGWRYDQGVCPNLVGVSEYMSGTVKSLNSVKVVDPQTVEFSLKNTDPKFPYKMLWAYILPQAKLKDQDPAKLAKSDWFLVEPVGTGPFKIFKYVKDQYMDLVPNENYWAGKPKLGHLINRYFTDEAAATIALEKGEIQFSYVSGDVAARLKTNNAYKVFEGSSFTSNYVSFNLRDKRLQDVRVRQAFMYAIDRKAIIKEIWKDTAYIIPCTLPQKDFWPSDVNAYDYNPTKAQQLLKDAGWVAGDSFELWTYYTAQQQKDALQAMQQYLAQVGMKLTPKIMDVPAYNATFYTGEGWTFSYRGYGLPMGQSPRAAMLDSTQTNDKKSWAGLADPTLGQLLTKAEQSLADADYTKGMQAVCKQLNDQVIEAPMWVGIRYGAITNKVKNFYYYPAPAGGPYEDHPELWEVGQ